MKNPIVISVVVAVIFGAAGFFGGMKYQSNQTVSQTSRGNGQFTGRGLGGNRNGSQAISGDIINTDNNSTTIKLQDGSSKIILIGSSTVINKTATGSASDLSAGTRVVIFGTANSDGSVTASNINVNPMFGGNRPSPTP